ncbi:MAG: hypothetical protein E5X51_25620, partial [Mesorhizobium sp.]
MNKLLLGAALLAAGVFGVDTSFVYYIRGSAGMETFAQEAQGSSSELGAPSGGGFGNGGAALGSGEPAGSGGSSSGQPPAAGAGDAASGGAAADDNPDAAAEVGTTDQSTDTEAAPEEPEAAEAAVAAETTTESGDPEAIGTPKVDLPKNSGNGNLGYAIGIDVSAFHGLEPAIALNYNSSRKTKIGGLYQGWLGYAWGLDGFDVIER